MINDYFSNFNDWRDLQRLFDSVKAAGLFVVFRPGPYINAETTAGGIAHWATSQVSGELRTNATDYEAAWKPYIQGIIDVVVPNQITNNGPIIAVQVDNEYSQLPLTHAEYFVELEAAYRHGGVVVPLTYNDPGMGSNFINGTGAVDLYGFIGLLVDEYPNRFDCANPEVWSPVMLNYHQYHEQVNPSEPSYFPEFQGGSLDGWGGAGYDGCEILTNANFEDVFYKQNWASNAKLMSFYMLYGYDYGAAIRENRILSAKYDELKRQGLFLRSSPQFYKTDWIGDTSTGDVFVNNSAAFSTLLKNPDSGTGFYITRQNDSTSTVNIDFRLQVETSIGTLVLPRTVPSISLNGRQSKVIVTDYSFGDSKLLYSTASIFFAGKIGSRDVLFVYGDSDQNHELALYLDRQSTSFTQTSASSVRFASSSDDELDTISILAGTSGFVTLWESTTQLILFADPITAATFWAPVVPGPSLNNYWQFGSNDTILVGGPYLVRNVTVENNHTLHLTGDLNSSVPLTIFAPDGVNSVSWNNDLVHTSRQGAALVGQVTMKELQFTKPPTVLDNWKFADSLPEVDTEFSDDDWIVANHTTTNIIIPPLFGDGRVLYGCDYGFCEGIVLWRGHFMGTGAETAVNLSISGGTAFAASVWINDVFIRSTPGDNLTPNMTNEIFDFPSGSIKVGKDNVITVLQDNSGLDETGLAPTSNDPKSPRGISGFELLTGNITTWKLQGKFGGYTNFPDKTRGILNEGGLFGERAGWHLPDFDTSSWPERSLSDGLPGNKVGVGFFVTTFNLDIPEGTDIPISFVFEDHSERYRAFLFVNGWKFGKRIGNLGPQTKFPVHQGLLNYNGKNTIAVALWALDANQLVSPQLSLVVDDYIEGGVGHIHVNNPPWEPRY
ncbi:hypothetical protein Clacol_005152 [Clathrus columnatus]|uniref:beta-galactosidase n=1 Tax=Clathrus columnatus TaxID=1419009 RepID=A0AAV5ABR7_9AGAM|nr:hypothetical protein Clacol_005152 [Clathrus columnatus]